jgi:SagB-type dehydrogenase family enzyme
MARIFRHEAALRSGPPQSIDVSVAELYHENTKLHRATALAAIADDSYGARELEAMARAYKRYRLRPHVPLPAVANDLVGPAYADVIASRRSTRHFAPDPLALGEVSALLQWSYGTTGEITMPGGEIQRFRAAPSAGALYPAEIYLGVRAVGGLDAGLYHYDVPDASLALLSAGDHTERLHAVCCGQEYARQAAIVVLISGVVKRTKRKYGERGYRYVLLDIGHLGENLYLAATALGLAMVTTCGFYDDEAADLLGVDGCDEAVFYVAFIGRSRSGTP